MLSGVTSLFSRDPTRDFPYTIGELVIGLENKSVWTLHRAQKKATKQEHTAFVYNIERGNAQGAELAKAALKRLKTLRHPNILLFADSLETDKICYMITESCLPLFEYLEKLPQKLSEDIIAWGLHQVLKGLEFINEQCNLCHNALSTASIFVTHAGEWKLCGFEYVSGADQPSPSRKPFKGVEVFEAPEISANHATKLVNTWSVDMWAYGAVTYEVFNGKLYDKQSLKNVLSIPSSFRTIYSELIASNPSQRPSPSQVLERCSKPGGFFHNDFLNTMKELDEIHLKTAEEKSRLLRRLNTLLDSMPAELSRNKVVPALISVFDFGTPDFTILPVLLKIGVLMQPEDFQKRVVPCVVKLFASSDRATRIHLLQNLKSYIDHLSKAVVNKDIFQHVCMGFLDTNPAMREETVKAMSLIAPKLDYKNLNEELMKYFARLQAQDDEGPIRTNTTICIAKIAPCMTPETREKVLPSAFSRAIRDPFEPARIAGIGGFMETHEYFTIKDTASKIVPVLCIATVDPDKKVRDQAFKAIQNLLDRLKQVSEKPELVEQFESKVNAGSTSVVNQLASSWIGAAVTSLATRFKQQKLQQQATPADAAATGSASTADNVTKLSAESDNNNNNNISKDNDYYDVLSTSRTPSPLHSAAAAAESMPKPASSFGAAAGSSKVGAGGTGLNRSLLQPTTLSNKKCTFESASTNLTNDNKKTAAASSWENDDLWLTLDGNPVSKRNVATKPAVGGLLPPKPSASTQSFHGWDEPESSIGSLAAANASTGAGSSTWSTWEDNVTFPNTTTQSMPAAAANKSTIAANNNNILQPTRTGAAAASTLAPTNIRSDENKTLRPSQAAQPPSASAGLDDDFFSSMLGGTTKSSTANKSLQQQPKHNNNNTSSTTDDWDPFGTRGGDEGSAQQRRSGKPMKLSAKRIG